MAQSSQMQEGLPSENLHSTILCVDDEKSILSALVRVFRPLKYRVLTASSGEEGLSILESESVDLIISDMRMPEMSGVEFLEKAATRWPDTMRILLTGYSDLKSTVEAINVGKIYKYINKPWEENTLKIDILRAIESKHLEAERRSLLGKVRDQNLELLELNSNLENKVRDRVRDIENMKVMLEKAYKELKSNLINSIGVFSSIIDAREGSMAGHSKRVAELAYKFSQSIGMSENDAQNLLFAALLHDIGKIALPDGLINRPFIAMTHDEQVELKQHPIVGESVLMSLTWLQVAAKYIRSHHELYDGSGFPDGLRGDQIPLGARILSILNEYDMLISGRLHLEPYDELQARNYLLENRGVRFDPIIVDKFIEYVSSQSKLVDEKELICDLKQLKPGMRLARDMKTNNGIVVLPGGYLLNQIVIDKLTELSRITGTNFRIPILRD